MRPTAPWRLAASSEAILMAGIQDVSNALVSDFKLNDVLRIILETIYRAKGFKRVILCVRDGRSNAMLGRFGFGPDALRRLPRASGFRWCLRRTSFMRRWPTASIS
jgi:hypothetical protein